jgi:hypothetical protein
MNGSIAVLIDEHDGVIAIPNDAIKNPREAVTTGAMLGLSADSITKELVAQGYNPTTSRGGFGGGGGRRGGGNGNGGGGNRGGGNGPGAGGTSGAAGSASGDVAAAVQQGGAQGGAQGGGGFGQGGFGGPQVSDADCKKIDDILKAHPKEKKQIDDLAAKLAALRPAGFGGGNRGGFGPGGGGNRQPGDSTRRRGGGGGGGFGGGGGGNRQPGDTTRRGGRGSPEMQAINEQLRTIETALNIDPRTAGACRRRQNGGASQAAAGAGGNRQANGQGGRGGQLTPANELGQRPARPKTGLVFTSDSSKTVFHPRIVQLGQGNLDYTEVVSGLKPGERVVMLGALALQAQRQAQQDRARQNASPLGGQPGGPGPGGGGPRGGGGGGGGGGGRGG